ncbi:hypothetical protein MYX65_02690 [Acidobacteria bacterium AH-259-L09]|nr:hypothetical protein [Acidobacteria bacterium AH-259-L09]
MKRFFVCSVLVLFGLSGVFLWSQQWQLVATLSSDVSEGETLLSVDWVDTGTAGYLVLIESRDGEVTETGEIEHIYGNYLVLKDRLKNDFVAGSKIYQ